MKTGEGKTLMCVCAAYLNSLSGKGVHIVTVNEYLAERDSKWMGRVYKFLGQTVGCILSNMSNEARKAARQTHFKPKADAPVQQEGTITYIFKLK